MKQFTLFLLAGASLLMLSGCFSNKTPASEILTGSLHTGSDVSSGIIVDTGSQATGVIQDTGSDIFVDDKNFDPKKSEDQEIEDLMQYIEKTVNE